MAMTMTMATNVQAQGVQGAARQAAGQSGGERESAAGGEMGQDVSKERQGGT